MSFFNNLTTSNNYNYPIENEGVEQYALSPDGHQRALDQCRPLTVNNFDQVRHGKYWLNIDKRTVLTYDAKLTD